MQREPIDLFCAASCKEIKKKYRSFEDDLEKAMKLVLPRDLHDTWLDPERPGDTHLVDMVQTGSEEISRAMTTGETTPATLF